MSNPIISKNRDSSQTANPHPHKKGTTSITITNVVLQYLLSLNEGGNANFNLINLSKKNVKNVSSAFMTRFQNQFRTKELVKDEDSRILFRSEDEKIVKLVFSEHWSDCLSELHSLSFYKKFFNQPKDIVLYVDPLKKKDLERFYPEMIQKSQIEIMEVTPESNCGIAWKENRPIQTVKEFNLNFDSPKSRHPKTLNILYSLYFFWNEISSLCNSNMDYFPSLLSEDNLGIFDDYSIKIINSEPITQKINLETIENEIENIKQKIEIINNALHQANICKLQKTFIENSLQAESSFQDRLIKIATLKWTLENHHFKYHSGNTIPLTLLEKLISDFQIEKYISFHNEKILFNSIDQRWIKMVPCDDQLLRTMMEELDFFQTHSDICHQRSDTVIYINQLHKEIFQETYSHLIQKSKIILKEMDSSNTVGIIIWKEIPCIQTHIEFLSSLEPSENFLTPTIKATLQALYFFWMGIKSKIENKTLKYLPHAWYVGVFEDYSLKMIDAIPSNEGLNTADINLKMDFIMSSLAL